MLSLVIVLELMKLVVAVVLVIQSFHGEISPFIVGAAFGYIFFDVVRSLIGIKNIVDKENIRG